MSDIRDWGKFIRGRWDWTRFGYEKGFPRGCQFTDNDAAVEFDSRRLLIEAKAHDGRDGFVKPDEGQWRYLADFAERPGSTALVLYGCGVCNDPYGVWNVGEKRLYDWRKFDKVERRRFFKSHIDSAMGIGEIDEAAS